jgi:hypothetical protein
MENIRDRNRTGINRNIKVLRLLFLIFPPFLCFSLFQRHFSPPLPKARKLRHDNPP